MTRLTAELEEELIALARLLVDQERARVVVPPQRSGAGHWFGGGNLTADRAGGLYLVGRYRNAGDSRTGLAAGERGLELAIFHSSDGGQSFDKVLSWGKAEWNQPGCEVLSIEGSALHWTGTGVELYVSSEKTGLGYPAGLEAYLKPGCGVWTIERLAAPSVAQLKGARLEPVFASRDPEHLHVKDPVCYDSPQGDLMLMFCTHPFNWSSSNTAFMRRRAGSTAWETPRFGLFPRGTTWDVAIARGTCLFDVPAQGAFRDLAVTLLFYDGGECVRNLEEHAAAVKRPRGYSCEEVGGVAYLLNRNWDQIHRLSTTAPYFVSPYGTGCSRYVDILSSPAAYYATWQQSQPDGSQPLVLNDVEPGAVAKVLT